MRTLPIIIILTLLAAVVLPRAAGSAQNAAGLEQSPADISYGVGFFLGKETRTNLASDGMGVDLDLVAMGFRDGFDGAAPAVPREQMDGVLAAVHREMERRTLERLRADNPEFQKLSTENLARSRKFHDLFGEQEGVVTLPSGVQYKVLRPGTGQKPNATSTIVLKAKIETTRRTVINEGDEPETLRVDQLGAGGRELLQLMAQGARWQFAVPPARAYGDLGRYPDIGPNETLVGTVELIEVR